MLAITSKICFFAFSSTGISSVDATYIWLCECSGVGAGCNVVNIFVSTFYSQCYLSNLVEIQLFCAQQANFCRFIHTWHLNILLGSAEYGIFWCPFMYQIKLLDDLHSLSQVSKVLSSVLVSKIYLLNFLFKDLKSDFIGTYNYRCSRTGCFVNQCKMSHNLTFKGHVWVYSYPCKQPHPRL